MDDASVVEVQIRRPPRSAVHVSARCHLGLPVVTDVPPILDDGTPFPTTHWLTCPLATLRISRIESQGGVRAADHQIATDEAVETAFEAAMDRYRQARDAMLPEGWDGPVPTGGVAGSHGGVKCLHAQYADTAAGNSNPIGEGVAASIEPLGCVAPCVVDGPDGPIRNDAWIEPR